MSQVISKDLQLWLKLHVLLEFLEPLSYIFPLSFFPTAWNFTHVYLKMRKDSRTPLCRFMESVCFIASFSQNSAMCNTAGFWFQPQYTNRNQKYPPMVNMQKTEQDKFNNCFQVLDNRQPQTVMPERRGKSRWVQWLSQLTFCWRHVHCYLVYKRENHHKQWLVVSLSWGSTDWGSGGEVDGSSGAKLQKGGDKIDKKNSRNPLKRFL